tara:strand:+ start:156 stop:542 length:387 start_codon:yes stop_codon:yes gene_type:complete
MKNKKQLSECQQQLRDIVDTIAGHIEGTIPIDPESCNRYCELDEEEQKDFFPDGYDYLDDIYDYKFIVDSNKNYQGARICVAYGGPNIFINTFNKQVEGYWGGDTYIKSYYEDDINLDNAIEELLFTT